MRNKVRKSLAFLLALALVVSVMSGLGLSVSAEQESNTPGTEEVQQQDKTEAGAAPSEVKAEEEAAKPEGKPVQEEKEDEQKKQEETKTDDAAKDDANDQSGDQKDEPQVEPAAEEPAEPVGEVANKQTLPVANAPRATMRNDIVVPEPSYKKKAEYNAQNDAYDLSLSVSGNVSSQTEQSMVDFLLILDKSNSMSGDRWTNTRNAAHNLINALDENKNLNVRYNVVTFYGAGTGVPTKEAKSQTNGWTSSANGAKNSIESEISSGREDGGTNYQAGIHLGIQQLQQARDGAQTVVVFLSDGAPTFRLTARDQKEYVGGSLFGPQYENYKYGNGDNDDNGYNIEEAVSEIGGMHVSQFYAIGLGNNFKTNLTKLNNAVDAAVKADDVYTTENSSGLEAIFKAIAGKINNIACKDVKITETINTQYAQVVTQTNGNPTKLTITVKKADGTVVKSGENSITLDATELNKESSVLNATYQNNQLVLDFPDKYQLEDGWTYTITTQVKPTQAAYEYYSDNNGSYPNSGDANTGTHSGEPGFWSNTSAVLDYTVSGIEKHATYDKPVIQVKAGTLKIRKNISGLTPEQIDVMKGGMTFTINKNGDAYKTIHLRDFRLEDETYTYEMPYCVPGATYTVTESGMDVDDFDCVTTVNGTSGVASGSATIVKGETKTIAFTNAYTSSAKNLTIEKKVEGQKPENWSAEFNFKIEGPAKANGDYTITGKTEKVTFTNGKANITISGESSITIEKLPLGTYTVTEISMGNVEHYTWTTSEKTGSAKLEAGKDGTVTITNILKKNPTVTIVKKITGNMRDPKDKFTFTYGDKQTVTLDGGDNSTEEIEVPYDSSFTVTESDKGGYTLESVSATNNQGTKIDDGWKIEKVTENTVITFTNEKTIQPPNGIITTIAPYAIMVVLAAGAGVYFVYSRRRHNG